MRTVHRVSSALIVNKGISTFFSYSKEHNNATSYNSTV